MNHTIFLYEGIKIGKCRTVKVVGVSKVSTLHEFFAFEIPLIIEVIVYISMRRKLGMYLFQLI